MFRNFGLGFLHLDLNPHVRIRIPKSQDYLQLHACDGSPLPRVPSTTQVQTDLEMGARGMKPGPANKGGQFKLESKSSIPAAK
jgi:hypothetical protein